MKQSTSEILDNAAKQDAYDIMHRGKPDKRAYPARNPHDMEWGGIDPRYWDDLKRWEGMIASQGK